MSQSNKNIVIKLKMSYVIDCLFLATLLHMHNWIIILYSLSQQNNMVYIIYSTTVFIFMSRNVHRCVSLCRSIWTCVWNNNCRCYYPSTSGTVYTYHPEFVLMSNRARLPCIILSSFSPCCFISISLLLLFCALYLVLYTLSPISSTKH